MLGGVLSSVALLAGTGDYSRFEKGLSKDQEILHALDRLTFGPRPGDVAAVKKLGLKKWIEAQLHPEQIAENPELERRLKPLESLRMTQADAIEAYPPKPKVASDQPEEPKIALEALLTPEQVRIVRSGSLEDRRALLTAGVPSRVSEDRRFRRRAQQQPAQSIAAGRSPELRRKLMLANNPQQVVAADLAEGKLFRAIYSNRQLEEVLTDFWFNHFNVDLNKGTDRFLVPTYERESIRPYVLGKFRDLLEATATSPAMLFYLDNWQSVAPQQPPSRKQAKQTKQSEAERLAA